MGKLFAGLVVGALMGAVTVMLLTPRSGPQLKSAVRERWQELMEEGQRASAERRAELEAEFTEVKRPERRGGQPYGSGL